MEESKSSAKEKKDTDSKGKKGKQVKRGRAAYKACDPFSGRSYPTVNEEEYNLEPDEAEEERALEKDKDVNDFDGQYKRYREKPKYRRDIILAEELEDMKSKKKESVAKDIENGRLPGETHYMFMKRMNEEKRKILLEELKKSKKTSDRKKKYLKKRKEKKEEKIELEKEERRERNEIIKQHTSKGYGEQAERPPQLSVLINRMVKNNKVFEREAMKIKPVFAVNRKLALSQCRKNMDRFDYVCFFNEQYNITELHHM